MLCTVSSTYVYPGYCMYIYKMVLCLRVLCLWFVPRLIFITVCEDKSEFAISEGVDAELCSRLRRRLPAAGALCVYSCVMAGRPLCGAVLGAVTTRLTVTVPVAIKGGELVRVAAPDGSYHSVMVPAGLTTGQQFSVELLAGDAEGDDAAELATIKVQQQEEQPPQLLPSISPSLLVSFRASLCVRVCRALTCGLVSAGCSMVTRVYLHPHRHLL